MITKLIDLVVSILPKPLLFPAIRLLQPELYRFLCENGKGITTQGDTSVITFNQGHIVIGDEIKPMS